MSIIPTPTTPTRTPSEENDSNMVQMSKSITRARTSRLRSAVWNDFDRIKKNDKDFAVCKLCKKEFVGGTASGTSHLKKHLERCPSRVIGDGSHPFLLTGRKRRERSVAVTSVKFIQESTITERFFRFLSSKLLPTTEKPSLYLARDLIANSDNFRWNSVII